MLRAGLTCACLAVVAARPAALRRQLPATIQNRGGLQLAVDEANADPALRVVLPGRPPTDRTIWILFPEHVFARRTPGAEAKRLYVFQPGRWGERPAWRRLGTALEYERDLPGPLHLLARATLEDDGVRFQYEITNHSGSAYDMIEAVTDPRLTGLLHDVRLERTYVHHKDGFDLLASETPRRLTEPLDQWLPSRYLAEFTWPVPEQRVDHRDPGITYYTKSRPVDQPFIATVSTDRQWVVASFTRSTGDVWSNPELTCQHVDPQQTLAPHGNVTWEVKVLIMRASLDAAFATAVRQRDSLQ